MKLPPAGYFCFAVFASYIQPSTKRKTISSCSKGRLFCKGKQGGSPKSQQGRQGRALSDEAAVPQDPSKAHRAGPVTVTRFCQLSRLSGTPVVMGQVWVRISIRIREVQDWAQAHLQHSSGRDQEQEPELKSSPWQRRGRSLLRILKAVELCYIKGGPNPQERACALNLTANGIL